MQCISSKSLQKLFDISRQKLCYWRKVGLFQPDEKSKGGHYRYRFQDLVALKTIKTLQDAGFTTYQIRKAFVSLKKRYTELSNPFVQKPVFVSGSRIAIIDKGKVYDALTGQMEILSIDLSKIETSIRDLQLDETKKPDIINASKKVY